jgi:hypothetical protein
MLHSLPAEEEGKNHKSETTFGGPLTLREIGELIVIKCNLLSYSSYVTGRNQTTTATGRNCEQTIIFYINPNP